MKTATKKPYTRKSQIMRTFHLSVRDQGYYGRALSLAESHDSGGSYSMVAMLCDPKPIIIGYNDLNNPAFLKHDSFPQECGMHAELSLWHQAAGRLQGGTVVVAGVVSKSRNEMVNTTPCRYCASLLSEVRWIICNLEGKIVKTTPSELK